MTELMDMLEILEDEIDGPVSEQYRNLIKAREILQERKNTDLAGAAEKHSCKRGMFCPVKRGRLSWQFEGDNHALSFEIPSHRFSMARSAGSKILLRVAVVDQGYKGSITCSCELEDCGPHLLESVCNLHLLLRE